MADWVFKLRILRRYVGDAVRAWWDDCGSRDLGEQFCCAGDPMECGCRGVSVRETLAWLLEEKR